MCTQIMTHRILVHLLYIFINIMVKKKKKKVNDKSSLLLSLGAAGDTFRAHILPLHECMLIPQNQSYCRIGNSTSTPAVRALVEYVYPGSKLIVYGLKKKSQISGRPCQCVPAYAGPRSTVLYDFACVHVLQQHVCH